jgi:hypothetical protein
MTISRSRFSVFSIASVLIVFGAEPSPSTDWAFEDSIEAIVGQMNEGSSQAFSDAVDADALLSRVFENTEVEERLRAGYSQQFIRNKSQLGENIAKNMPDGSYAKLLNVEEDGQKGTALVRYDYGNRGFGYHQYELVMDEAGNIRIVDWFDYLDGFRYSDALRLSVVVNEPTAASVRGLVPEHQGNDEEYAKLAAVISAYYKQDYKKFYSDSATLSRKLRQTRFMHLMTCLVSRMSRDKNLYNDAYRALSNNFGDDPAVVLTLINYYFSKGDYEQVTASLRLLQEEFGVRDAALLTLMSRTALGLRNADEASFLADEAITIEPGLESAYWAAIDAHVTLDHHSFAVMTARSLEDQFEKSIEREKFENKAIYSDFIESPQFKQWQAEKQLQ